VIVLMIGKKICPQQVFLFTNNKKKKKKKKKKIYLPNESHVNTTNMMLKAGYQKSKRSSTTHPPSLLKLRHSIWPERCTLLYTFHGTLAGHVAACV